MTDYPQKAFVLAAGLGVRMRPLTDHCPKPLLKVDGVPMIDRALEALEQAGVTQCVVNLHYLPHMLEEHLRGRKGAIEIIISHEQELLETGGGVARMLDVFQDEPFYVLNGDVIWQDGDQPALKRLAHAWDDAQMDALLLLHPIEKLQSFDGRGDYYLPGDFGAIEFVHHSQKAPNTIFAGPRLVHPRLFAGAGAGHYSFLSLFHAAEAKGRLYGLKHDGDWYHVGTPEELEQAESAIRKAQ